MIEDVALFVGKNVNVMKEDLAFFDLAIAFLEANVAGADRFYFCAAQLKARLNFFQDGVIVEGLAIAGYLPVVVARGNGNLFLSGI